jgi:two-component system sensor histidine kinase RpfC
MFMLKRLTSMTRFEARALEEREVMRNRLGLSGVALFAAFAAQAEGAQASDFLRDALPILLAYLVGSAGLMIHMDWRPSVSAARLALALSMDSLTITAAMIAGGEAAIWLFPLYWWLILGAGARLGADFLGLTVGLAAAGFGLVVAETPFWLGHPAFALSLLLSIVVLPVYGAVLLRNIAEARAQAERANRAKTMFLASVTHELRTPLTAIIGLTSLLAKTPLDSEQRDMSKTLSEAAQTLLGQIEHLLAGARDEIRAEARPDETVDLHALLESLRAMLAVEAEAKGVRLGLTIEADAPRVLRGDRRALQEIFQNVVGNAVKFTRDGAVEILVGARRRDDRIWLHVEVRDTGPGIPLEAQAHIFEPFRQGEAATGAKYGGAGLGLALVRQRLEAMGGEIALESRPGAGALFRLGWPVEEVLGVASPVGAAATDVALPRKPRILLAEDNVVNSRVLEKILSGANYEVVVAADGEAALLLMLGEDFDVVLLDVNMPRLGGVEVARINAAAKPRGRAPIALTADDSADIRSLCRAAGMAGCLRKPIAPEALLAAVDLAARGASAPPAAAPADAAEDATFDPATLSALNRIGGDAFVRELLVQFATDAARLVDDIHASFAGGDAPALRRQAHALESMAGNMGALALARLCREWRGMSEQNLAQSATRASEDLRLWWRVTQDALGRALVQKGPAGAAA